MAARTILIVDDEADVRKVLEKRPAVTMRILPDLTILDINLPDLDGGEVGQILKASPATAHIPIIFLTALVARREAKASSHQIAGNIFSAKPYDPQALLSRIGTLLEPAVSTTSAC